MLRSEKWLAALMGALFLFFSLPKLQGWNVSIQLFDVINSYLGLTGSWFRVMTGVIELTVGAILVLGALLTREVGNLRSPYALFLLGVLGTIGTMVGALFVELAIRPGEDMALTVLAFGLLGLGVFLFWRHRQYVPILGPLLAAFRA